MWEKTPLQQYEKWNFWNFLSRGPSFQLNSIVWESSTLFIIFYSLDSIILSADTYLEKIKFLTTRLDYKILIPLKSTKSLFLFRFLCHWSDDNYLVCFLDNLGARNSKEASSHNAGRNPIYREQHCCQRKTPPNSMVRLILAFYRLQDFWGHINANTGDQSY